MHRNVGIRTVVLLLALLAIFAVVAEEAYAQTSSATSQPTAVTVPAANGPDLSYKLGTGDKIHLNIFGQGDLSGDYVVDATGYVQLPLIGQVKAAGQTVRDFQTDVTAKLADGFLKDPNVSIQVVNYRPFYIIGEVRSPGQYPYVSGMSLLNAVALAGGYTYRADDTDAYIRRNGSNKEAQFPADETTKVEPGDIIRISERFF